MTEPTGSPMTRRRLLRDAALLIVAAVIVAVLAFVGRSQQAASCRRDGCLVNEAQTAWREYERVDWA